MSLIFLSYSISNFSDSRQIRRVRNRQSAIWKSQTSHDRHEQLVQKGGLRNLRQRNRTQKWWQTGSPRDFRRKTHFSKVFELPFRKSGDFGNSSKSEEIDKARPGKLLYALGCHFHPDMRLSLVAKLSVMWMISISSSINFLKLLTSHTTCCIG